MEAAYGVLQCIGLFPSHHSSYPVTGSFYNPGPYGCYLSLSFPLALSECFRGKSNMIRYFASIVVLFDAFFIPLSMSRTALIAAILGSFIVFYRQLARIFRSFSKISLCLSAILVCIAFWGMYKVKQDSANGRILIWKVALGAIVSDPFTGVGAKNVAGEYGNAQERYFAEGNGSELEERVAGAPEYVFNEFLQTAIAYGWGWALILLLLILFAFVYALKNCNLAIAGSIIAAMVVMTFSYPFQFPLATATIAVIMVGAFFSVHVTGIRLLLGVTVVYVCFYLYNPYDYRYVSHKFSTGILMHNSQEWRKSNLILIDMLPYSSDPMPLVIIGKNYYKLGITDSAEYYLRRAVNRCPNRLYPHYLLMQLFLDSLKGNPSEAIEEAMIILTQKEKIPSRAVEEMRREARRTIGILDDFHHSKTIDIEAQNHILNTPQHDQ